jgi:hypothetical protein
MYLQLKVITIIMVIVTFSKKYNAKVVQLASNTKECIVMFKIYVIFLFKLWIT